MEKYNFGSDESYLLQNNLLGIDSLSELELAEQYVFTVRALQVAQKNYKINHHSLNELQLLHKHLFQDIYSFAGQLRNVQLVKGDTRFCHFEHIVTYGESIFHQLKQEGAWLSIEEAAERLAYYKSELNMLHPFREGNGRTIRLFIQDLARNKGYNWDFENMNKEQYMNAMILAKTDITALTEIFVSTLEVKI